MYDPDSSQYFAGASQSQGSGAVALRRIRPAARMSSSVSSGAVYMRWVEPCGRENPIRVIMGKRAGSLMGPSVR